NAGLIQLTSTGGAAQAKLDLLGGTLINNAGGTIALDAGTGGSRVINAGISNSGTINFNTSATLDIGAINFNNNSGGLFTVASGVTVNIQDDNNPSRVFNNSGTVVINATGQLVMNGTDIVNLVGGLFTVNGTLWMGDGSSATGGGDFTNNGTIDGSGTIKMQGGTFTGNAVGGTVTLAPGNSPGKLAIDGAVVFTNNSKLVIELGGRKAVEEYDQLTVTGRYALAGTLAVAAYGAFAAAAYDSFDVVQYGSKTGMFHEITGLDQYAGVAIDPVFTDTGITLNARAITSDGTAGDDMLNGTDDDDALVGRDGNDVLSGGLGSDLLLGGAGNDILKGGAGDDRLIGGEGRDTADYRDATSSVSVDLSQGSATGAGIGVDTLVSIEDLIGSASVDTLIGNDRDNRIDGGGGKDVLTGGAGRDVFVVGSPADAGDTITDFVSGQDALELDAVSFALGDSSLIAGRNFSVIGGTYDGSSAGDNAAFTAKQATFVYSSADHALYYDSNGSDPGGYSTVVTLQPNATLVATDIHLITRAAA
ncbi:MAG: calcium-binding protein, partial [Alphaproteobacteria bacterium]|nr:calcium-binding protein [Alphaproteobacteria bacterium]